MAIEQHPRYPLIVAANRDEYVARPSEALHRWNTDPCIYAGRDQKAGGTWIGLSETGQLAMVTNFRVIPPPSGEFQSRGQLPIDFLLGRRGDFEAHLRSRGSSYAPVNLLWGEGASLSYWSNQSDGIERLAPGVHGLSNAFLNEDWPKVERGKRKLAELVSEDLILLERLLNLLDDESAPADADLPETGLPRESEKALASIRIPIRQGYGSRTATVVLCNGMGEYKIVEKNYQTGQIVNFVIVTR